MSHRNADALAIQQGACNPLGIARALVKACDEAREDLDGTVRVAQDPAVRLIVHQLAYICRVSELDDNLDVYHKCTEACES